MKTKVYLLKGEDAYSLTKELIRKTNFKLKNKKVLIKPNLTTSATAREGITPDIGIIKAVLESLKDCDITIGDCGGNIEYAFKNLGYYDLQKDFNFKLLDLNKDEIVYKDIPKPYVFKKIPIAKTVLDSEYIINVSKLKIHSLAKVTLSIKNMFGCVPTRLNRIRIHPHINRALLDIMQVVKSDFNIIDGIYGNQGDEVVSNPVHSSILIGGYDMIGCDTIGSKCMGVNPDDVEYLRLARELFGEREIEVIGKNIEDVKKEYSKDLMWSTRMRYRFEKGISYLLRKRF